VKRQMMDARVEGHFFITVAAVFLAVPALAADRQPQYRPITPTMADHTVTLTGHDLTVDQVIEVARHGAQVQLSPEAKQRELDNYGLLLEAPAEGISVYWFNRAPGQNREMRVFSGDPMDPGNRMPDGTTVREYLENKMLSELRHYAKSGDPPEILDEDLVRAVMVVRANAMTYDAPSPQLSQMLIDMLNKRITPVMMSRGSTGSTDMAQTWSIGGPMVGAADCYYQGVRMASAEALRRAGLKPIQPFAADDNALTSSNAYSTAMAAFIVADAKEALEWADLTYAIDLNGMNSATSPLSYLVQTNRPFPWINWDATRVKEMLRGSYLFADDPQRIIQDPESLRAAAIRQGTAWKYWAILRDDVLTQLNSSDHNPAIRAGLSPEESWDLDTPEMLRYYVKGGKNSRGMHGFILSNANWDPFPIATDLEAFSIAMADMDIMIMLRIERFGSTFFTRLNARDVLKGRSGNREEFEDEEGFVLHDVMQDIQTQIFPVPPQGFGGASNVEELQSQTRIRAQHATAIVEDTWRLLADDLVNGARWLDVRQTQNSARQFGAAPSAAWSSFRRVVPLEMGPAIASGRAAAMLAYDFLKTTSASTFFPISESSMPDGYHSAGTRSP